jgi:hypothetical protein
VTRADTGSSLQSTQYDKLSGLAGPFVLDQSTLGKGKTTSKSARSDAQTRAMYERIGDFKIKEKSARQLIRGHQCFKPS